MTEHSRSERLQSLTAEANEALRDRAKRLASLPVLAPGSESGSRRVRSPEPSASLGAVSSRRGLITGEATAGVADVKTAREERSVRALAKEIKRLLTEDRRRGLGVGG